MLFMLRIQKPKRSALNIERNVTHRICSENATYEQYKQKCLDLSRKCWKDPIGFSFSGVLRIMQLSSVANLHYFKIFDLGIAGAETEDASVCGCEHRDSFSIEKLKVCIDLALMLYRFCIAVAMKYVDFELILHFQSASTKISKF